MTTEQNWEFLPDFLRTRLSDCGIRLTDVEEIRLRCNRPVQILCGTRESWLMTKNGDAWILTEELFAEMLEKLCHASPYVYEEQVRQGFFTIEGGHRIGVGGTVVVENGTVVSVAPIRSLNIRIAHEIKGCANPILDRFRVCGVGHTLILSPPGMGKTTLLRDLVRQVSNYIEGKSLALIDERKEIAGCYRGNPQYDVGKRTDVLDGCPKDQGMLMAVRALAPSIMAVDEIGGREDVEAIRYVIRCGCKLFVTVHGNSLTDLQKKPCLNQLLSEHCFDWFVLIRGHGDYQVMTAKEAQIW